MLYPINVHSKDGKMIVSLAFKTEEKAKELLETYNQFWSILDDGSRVLNAEVMRISDDFGHELVVSYSAIGFMIYVDEELDNELGEYIAKKMSAAQEKARVRDKIVKV